MNTVSFVKKSNIKRGYTYIYYFHLFIQPLKKTICFMTYTLNNYTSYGVCGGYWLKTFLLAKYKMLKSYESPSTHKRCH